MDITPGDKETEPQFNVHGDGHASAPPAIQIPPLSMSAAMTSGRYDQEVHLIKAKYGDLESIRARLNLSKRKVCELLLVDPSSWSRWTTQSGDDAPPYIYRSLQWYLSLIDKDVAWHPMNSFLGLLPKKGESMQFQKLKEELQLLKTKLKDGAVAQKNSAHVEIPSDLQVEFKEEINSLKQMIQKKQDLSSAWKLLVMVNLIALGLLLFEQFMQ